MTAVKITLSSGKTFPAEMPLKLDYYMSFGSIADYLVYEGVFYDNLNLEAKDTVTFEMTPVNGTAFTFVGQLYSVKKLSSVMHLRMLFVSKYFNGLASAIPLYGSGDVADIIAGFYRKIEPSLPAVEKDMSGIKLENVCFPRTATVSQAIAYLLERATAPRDGILYSTVVQDRAYIRNIKNGKTDVEGMYYDILTVRDNRRRVDAMGGIELTMLNDQPDIAETTQRFEGNTEIERNVFYAFADDIQNRARARVRQARVYYNNYVVKIRLLGWAPLFGSNMVVRNNGKDMYKILTPELKSLSTGKYFVHAQSLGVDFKSSKELSTAVMSLVEAV